MTPEFWSLHAPSEGMDKIPSQVKNPDYVTYMYNTHSRVTSSLKTDIKLAYKVSTKSIAGINV